MKKVLLLLADGFEAFEAAAFSDVLGWADEFGSEPIEIVTAALRERLQCTFAFDVLPMALISQIDLTEFDALAIPGGFERAGFYNDAYAPEFTDAIRAFAELDRPIASVCVGALPIARSGILEGRRATTYDLMQGKRRAELAAMGAVVVDAAVVADGNIITSTSPATAVDVAFALLEALTSTENAQKIRALMGFG